MNIKKRNIVAAVILSIVTCGIYGLYWAFMLGKEAASVKDPADSGILESILIMFIPFIGFYLAEKKFAAGCQEKGIEHKDNSIIYLVLGLIFPIADYCWMQSELNKIAE